MNTWDQLESGTGGPFGDKVFFFTPSITMEKPAEFWRIFNDNSATPPVGDNEDFSITPGLETNLYIKDSLGAYFGFELLEAPDLPESRFEWNKDGSYTVSLTTFGSPITFTYRRFSSNPLIPFGPPTTVVIAGDNSAFTDPEPYPAGSDPEDQFVDAYVLEYGGFLYPAYQFFLAHSPFDLCKEPHWHSSVDVFLWKLLRVASRIRILPNVVSVFSRSCHPKRLRFP
jgi:hypothetical protein